MRKGLGALLLVLLTVTMAVAAVKSGPQVSELVLPFTSNVVVGPYRGMQHCFVCDAKPNQIGLVFFARNVDKVTAKAVNESVKTVSSATNGNLISWLVFLGPKGTKAEEALGHSVEAFATQNAMLNMHITVLGDPAGPPGYRVSPDAALTMVLFRNLKVVANGAWTGKDWSDKTADDIVQQITTAVEALQ